MEPLTGDPIGNEVAITVHCSCGATLKGVLQETDVAWETHVVDGVSHLKDGHTIVINEHEITYDLLLLSQMIEANEVNPN